MTETIQLGDMSIQVTRKDIKNVHLSVHPPERSRDPGRPQPQLVSKWPAPTPFQSWAGFASSKRNCRTRPAKRLASSSSARATTSGDDATS